MSNKYFFVIYPPDNELRFLLNSIRLIADSNQSNLSHITVRGPYFRSPKKLLDEENKHLKEVEILVNGAGNFFSEHQNTVFFKCIDNPTLYSIWKKKEEKTYKKFIPHITIYDGQDSSYANEIFKILQSSDINFNFTIKQLEIYCPSYKEGVFNLKGSIDYKRLSNIANMDINDRNVSQLKKTERLKIIRGLCEKIEKLKYLD